MNEARRTGGLTVREAIDLWRRHQHQAGTLQRDRDPVSVYFLATGVNGLQLLGAQNYLQQLFYGAALVVAVVLSRQLRRSRA